MDPVSFAVMLAVDAVVSFGISYLFPAQGPRMKDLTVSASTYGAAIPQIFGEARAAGNLIWSQQIQERANKQSGGKGGTSVNYTYYCTFAFAFAVGPINDIVRLWADGKVIFDTTGASPQPIGDFSFNMRIYYGTEDQLPDPSMESIDGPGNVPAYRGLAYIVFEQFYLTNFGNRIPQFAAQVVVAGTGSAVFKQITATDTVDTINSPPFNPFNPNEQEGVPNGLLVWGNNMRNNVNISSLIGGGVPQPSIDFGRGLAYFTATGLTPSLLVPNGTTATFQDELYALTNCGITRVNGQTLKQDMDIYTTQLDLGTYTDYGYGYNALLVTGSYFGSYPGFVSEVIGCGNDGSIYVAGFYEYAVPFFTSSFLPPTLNSVRIFKLDPTTYAVTNSTVSDYKSGTSPDGDSAISIVNGNFEVIFSLDGTRMCYPGASSVNDDGSTVPGGGFITIFNASNLEFISVVEARRSSSDSRHVTEYGQLVGICPYQSSNFTFMVDRDNTGRWIDFYTDAIDGAATPFHTDDGGAGATRDGLWCMWDQAANGIIYCYAKGGTIFSNSGESAADVTLFGTSSLEIAKYTTDANQVTWRQNIGLILPLMSGKSVVNGTFGFIAGVSPGLSYGQTISSGVDAGVTIAAFMMETIYGNFQNIAGTTGTSTTSSGTAVLVPPNGLTRASETSPNVNIGAAYYTAYDYTTTSWPITNLPDNYDTSGLLSQVWNSNTTSLYLTSREVVDMSSTGSLSGNPYAIVQFNGTGGTNLGEIISTLLIQAGLTINDFDLGDLGSVTIPGYGFANNSDIKSIITELRQVYLFDIFESDFILKARLRGDATPDLTLLGSCLGSSSPTAKDEWKQTRMQEADLPAQITLAYINIDIDYQASTAHYARPSSPIPVMFSKQQASLQANICMESTAAANLVRQMLYTQWTERTKHDTRLPLSYIHLDPSDLIEVNFSDGRSYFERVDSTELGADFTIVTSTFSQDSDSYVVNPRIVGDGGTIRPNVITLTAPATPLIVNTPLLRDSDDSAGTTSHYYTGVGSDAAGGSGVFVGAALYNSSDGTNYTEMYQASVDTEWGKVGAAIPPPPRGTCGLDWETQITITPCAPSFSLSSITDDELYFGSNPLIIGEEVIQFRDVVQNANGTWTISALLRGRRGTEYACYTHGTNETVIAPDATTLLLQNETPSGAGKTLDFKAVTSAASLTAVSPTTIVYYPRDLMPYTVSDIRRALASDITITWNRRTRLNGNMVDGTGVVPLNETIESYEVYFLTAPFSSDLSLPTQPTYQRMETVSSPTFVYTGAMQAADAFDQATDTLHLVIFQLSGVVGRGFPSPRDITPAQSF